MSLLKNICKKHYNIKRKTLLTVHLAITFHTRLETVQNILKLQPLIADDRLREIVLNISLWTFQITLASPNTLLEAKFLMMNISQAEQGHAKAIDLKLADTCTYPIEYEPHSHPKETIKAVHPTCAHSRTWSILSKALNALMESMWVKPINHCAPQYFHADTLWKTETPGGRTFLTI